MIQALGAMLVYVVDPRAADGWVLHAAGVFVDEVAEAGPELENYALPPFPHGLTGLLIFEGWLTSTGDPDPDIEFIGQWRRLEHWEMCRVRCGEPPWRMPLAP